jgi:hypothetical protein
MRCRLAADTASPRLPANRRKRGAALKREVCETELAASDLTALGQGPKVSRGANLVGTISDNRHGVALTAFSLGPEARI